MEIKENQIYLTRGEQIATGYESPLSLDTFDLHGAQVEAKSTLERLQGEGIVPLDEDSTFVAASLSELARAEARNVLTHEISKELGRRILAEEGTVDIETFLRDH